MQLIATRRPLLGRIRARVRVAYLRFVIREAEKCLALHQAEFDYASTHLPRQLAHDKAHIEKLTRDLMRADQET